MRHIVALAAAGFSPFVVATEVAVPRLVQAPTLSEIGLGALVVLLAGVAGWVIRKRR